MIKLNYNILRVLLFVFISIQAITFITRENMQAILIFDYSIILSIIFLFTISKQNKDKPIKFFYLSALVIVSFVLYLYGFAGSISGNILAASIPFFIFNHFKSYQKLIDVLFLPIQWGSIIMIVLGTVLFIGIRDQLSNMILMTQYFIKASINYVSLMFYGCAMIYFMLYEVKKKAMSVTKFDYIICILILSISAFYSAMYDTRTTFVASIILLVVFFREKKIILFGIFVLAFIIFSDEVYKFFVEFLGSDSVGELAVQDVRVESINYLINNALDFNYDFSNTMSHSSLINVIFCLFPFTLFFAADLIITASTLFQIKSLSLKIYYAVLFTIGIFICTYQMDFFSVFTLFMCSQFIIFEKTFYNNKGNLLAKMKK